MIIKELKIERGHAWRKADEVNGVMMDYLRFTTLESLDEQLHVDFRIPIDEPTENAAKRLVDKVHKILDEYRMTL